MIPWLVVVAAAQASSVHVDQARIDLRRRFYDEVIAEVQAGLLEPGGDSFELYALGTDAAWEIGDIDRVLRWSGQAAGLALNADLHDAWQARHDNVASGWGWVVVAGPQLGARSSLAVDSVSPVFDPEQKRIAAVICQRVHAVTTLPVRVALPVGRWMVNGAAVTVVAGETGSLELSPDQVGLVGLRALRLEVAVGAEVPTGAQLARSGPGVAVGVALSGPVGPLRVGGQARWMPASFVSDGGHPYWSPWAGAAGLALGGHAPVPGGLTLWARVGPEVVLSEGVRVSCPGSTCAASVFYVPAWAVGPSVEVGVEASQGPVIVGVGLGGSLSFGRTFTGGAAVVEGTPTRWAVEADRFSRGSVRIVAYFGT